MKPPPRRFCSRNILIICRFFVRIRSAHGQGIDLDRSRLADWVGRTAWHLRPLYDRLLARLRRGPDCLRTRRPRPCLIPAEAASRPDSSGPIPATISREAAVTRQAWSTLRSG